MSDIADLQARITSALDRIGSGLEALGDAGDSAEVTELKSALEEERTANAQLEARVSAIKEKQEKTVNTLASEVERLRGLLQAEEAMVARLGRVNDELRRNNIALREAITAGVAEPHLINKAMMAELESLRATQSADRAELDTILGELTPLVDEARQKAAEKMGAGEGETAGSEPDLSAIMDAAAAEDEEHTDA
ncbi:MAG: hypothetical protein P8X66_11225 [Maritimibacter sp.]